jgi:hypothetical protein
VRLQVLTHVAAAVQIFERLIVFGLQLMAPLTVVSCSACEQLAGSLVYTGCLLGHAPAAAPAAIVIQAATAA